MPMSTLALAADTHVSQNNLKGRTPVHHCARWERLTGIKRPADVTTESIVAYRRQCVSLGYSPRSIEGSVSDVLLAVRVATGRKVDAGKRLNKTRPSPQPTSLATVAAVYEHCPAWVRQWLAISFATCLRLEDSLRLQKQLPTKRCEVLTWQASKTGHQHAYPVSPWLQRHLLMHVVVPNGKTYCHLQDCLRAALTVASEAAGVPRVLPKRIRQRALTEWSRADAMAGRIIHGCGLGVLDFYVDPLTVLEAAEHKVRLPDCFATDEERQQMTDISVEFAKLDPEAQTLVRSTMKRLA